MNDSDATPAFPTASASGVGWLTEAQMFEVDRVMIEDLHIELIQMMENAGRNLARLVLAYAAPSRVAVFAGSGGNGGGGLVAARHLMNAGIDVRIHTTKPASEMTPIPRHQLDILERMGAALTTGDEAIETEPVDVAIDAVIGYSLKGAPRGVAQRLIRHINELRETTGTTVVALDVPSGLDTTTGNAPGDVVHADATMTLAQPKVGLAGAQQVGDLYVADISVPPSVIRAMNLSPVDYARSTIVGIEN